MLILVYNIKQCHNFLEGSLVGPVPRSILRKNPAISKERLYLHVVPLTTIAGGENNHATLFVCILIGCRVYNLNGKVEVRFFRNTYL